SDLGTWIGNGVLDGTRYRVDSFQLTLGDSAASGGVLYFDNFRVAKKTTAPVNVAEQPENRPKSYSLEQNYPNPFNPATTIAFSVPKKGYVTLMIYNVMGEYVATLVDRTVSPGDHKVTFQGENLSSGVYYYRLIYDGGRLTRKMLLTK
ncbi:MAG TPA: T9SS type A sorting domain-containing protein, partial [Bacteroidetes bacterium]|nr:T9SS type A sorting domain-containing protein [Bacteroidota bacterium]